MRKNRCQLCGGKTRNGKCVLCGWVNQENREYLLNRSRCDDKPLTHVHREDTFGAWDTATRDSGARKTGTRKMRVPKAAGKQPQKQTKRSGNPRRSRRILIIVIVVMILWSVIPAVLGAVFYLFRSVYQKFESGGGTPEYDIYQNVSRELEDSGESWSSDLSAGEYVAGVDIPEGAYDLNVVSGDGIFRVQDSENFIYQYESFGPDEPSMDDVRLYSGAHIMVDDDLVLHFETENGQTDSLAGEPNPLTESVPLKKDGTAVAGEDFPAGVYDVAIEDAFGVFFYEVPVFPSAETEEDRMRSYSMFLDSDWGKDGSFAYRNVTLPEGTRVSCDAEFTLIPAERIISEDYLEYYE